MADESNKSKGDKVGFIEGDHAQQENRVNHKLFLRLPLFCSVLAIVAGCVISPIVLVVLSEKYRDMNGDYQKMALEVDRLKLLVDQIPSLYTPKEEHQKVLVELQRLKTKEEQLKDVYVRNEDYQKAISNLKTEFSELKVNRVLLQ